MKDWMTCREAASLWNVTERWVSGLCSSGKLAGAVKNGRKWLIPADTAKPMDSRIKTGKYIKSRAETKKLPLPVGISDYCKAQSDYYYVDKTLFIRDLLDQKPFVSLFTRPRRFGKTLNMNMLRVFFEKSETDTSIYFRNKNIWKCGPEYQKRNYSA